MMLRLSTRRWFLAVCLIFLIFALHVRAIHSTHMHADEELSYRATTGHTLSEVVRYEALNDVHPPAWYALFWGWQQLVGDSEFAGRFHAILLSMLTLSLAYQMGRRWYGAPRFGLFAAAMVGVNAYFFIYSLDIRPYALVMFAVTLSMWTFYRWLTRLTARAALVYGMTLALLLYVHYYTVFIWLVQALVVVCRRPSRRVVLQGLGAGAVAFALWSPWLPVFLSQMLTIRALTASQEAAGMFVIGAPTERTSIQAVGRLLAVATNDLPWLYGAVLASGLLSLGRKRAYWIALLWSLLAPVAILGINLAAAIYTQRYIAYISVGIGLAMGAALAALPARLRWPALIAAVGLSLWMLPALLPVRTPYRDLLRRASALAQPDDALYFSKADQNVGLVNWQHRHYLAPQLRANAVSDLREALGSRRIWFVTADIFDPQVQAEFKQIEPTHPQREVLGKCDSQWCYLLILMEAPPLIEPVAFADHMAFWGVDVDSVSRAEIQARLWWRVEETPGGDYSIGLYLLDRAGVLVAQADGPIHNFGSEWVSTTQMMPGAIYIDYRTLPLPGGLPAGEYDLMLAVYRWTDGVRLKLPDGSDLLALDVISLP